MSVCIRTIRYLVLAVLTVALYDRAADVCFVKFYEPAPSLELQPVRCKLSAPRSAGASSTLSAQHDRLAANDRAQSGLRAVSLFSNGRGMHSTPAFAQLFDCVGNGIGWKQHLLRQWFADRTGLLIDDANEIVGFHRSTYQNVPVVAQGCAVCHVGKVLGHVVPGLGNKNIDPFMLASTGHQFLRAHPESSPKNYQSLADELAADASRFHSRIVNERRANLTQGMVSVATIWNWFYEQAGEQRPLDLPRGACKVPNLWGYGEKRSSGQFCDGVAEGKAPGWTAMVELVAGQRPDGVRGYEATLEHLEGELARLLPPSYPLAIDSARADRGAKVFQQECQSCHGAYERDRDDLPLFQAPKLVDIEEVGTDDDRLRSITTELKKLIEQNPLSDLIRIQPNYRPAYFAPRLEGIWARFPYLHNGSVPSVAALLAPPEERPTAFLLRDAGEVYRFDPQSLGLSTPARESDESGRLIQLGMSGTRDIYFVEREGHSNRGHEYGTTLDDADKRDLIEYLKTL
jgi:hypothetical protein